MTRPRDRARLAVVSLLAVTLLTVLASAVGTQATGAFSGDGGTSTRTPAAASGANAAMAAPQSNLVDSLRLEDVFGVQVIGAVGASLQQGGGLVHDAGARFVSFGIDWSALAPLSTTEVVSYTWAPIDTAISETTALGFSVIATLGGNPTWAASYRRGPVDCVSVDRWDEYVRAVVERYKGSVQYWAIYNEPDGRMLTPGPICPGAEGDMADFGRHPLEYVEALRRAHDTIALEDPTAVVLFGGIAYDWFTDEGGAFVRDFLTDTLELGAASYFDAMNLHYYPDYDARWTQLSGRPGLMGKVESVRSILRSHGSDKPIVLTEIGSSSSGEETEDSQSRKVIQLYARAMAARVKVAVWYVLKDYGEPDHFGNHGLLYSDYFPKPSLSAYRTLAERVTGYSYHRPLAAKEWGASNLEGYVFQRSADVLQTSVVWTSDSSTRTLALPTGVFSVTDKYGAPRDFAGTLDVDGDPLFVLRHGMELYLPLVQRQ